MQVRVSKETGTYADTLCAVGYATLLEEMTGATTRIVDVGHAFDVCASGGRPPQAWPAPSPGFVYIWRESKEPEPPPIDRRMDYEAEQVIAKARQKAKTGRAKKAVEQALAETGEHPLAENHPEYRLAAIVESMRKGWSSDKALFRWLDDHGEECLDVVRRRCAGQRVELDCDWSNSQLLNPSTGKGVHSSKTVAQRAGGFKLTDAFDDWMKMRGLFSAMLAYRSGDDFKLVVVEPGDIATNDLAKLRHAMRDLQLWGVVRLDIESVLRLVQLLMRHSEFDRGNIPVRNRRPNTIVRGLRQSFFKSLGTAAALMNDALLPLPDWFVIQDRGDVDAYLQIVTEPYGEGRDTDRKSGPLSPLKDDHSSDVGILQLYRRWLASGQLSDLLEFHAAFVVELMQRIAANEYAPAFKTRILHLLLSKGYPEVKDIIESPGFLSVARAIRNTTIYAVGMKSSKRDVRFGLAQKWKQRIRGGNAEFVAEMSDFVQQQNWEVAHKLEGRGHVVTTSDLNQVVDLVAKHKAELVGMLLLAYGFSRAEKTGAATEEPASETAAAVAE